LEYGLTLVEVYVFEGGGTLIKRYGRPLKTASNRSVADKGRDLFGRLRAMRNVRRITGHVITNRVGHVMVQLSHVMIHWVTWVFFGHVIT